MSAEPAPPPVSDPEFLARFVLFSGWLRKTSNTVKPDAFTPYPHPNLSVTRHLGLSQEELWHIGQEIADSRPATLHGRADIIAGNVRKQSLDVIATPHPRNHANITGWPVEKSAQKSIAQELAATAVFHPH